MVKNWWNTDETLETLKHQTLWNSGENLVKHWLIIDETLVKQWWNTGETQIKHWLSTGKTLAKHWWNICETLSKHLWYTGKTLLKPWWNLGETVVKHLWNTCEKLETLKLQCLILLLQSENKGTNGQTEWQHHFLSCLLQLNILYSLN